MGPQTTEREWKMGLSDSRISAVVAVSDVAKAKEFYEGKLGLSGGGEEPDGGVSYSCGENTELHIYPSPDNAGKSGATLVAWTVGDVEASVDELSGNGITFEQYGDPINTDEKGIARFGDEMGAFFKDPDGNILALGSDV